MRDGIGFFRLSGAGGLVGVGGTEMGLVVEPWLRA
jgi:hypothetical protein